MFGLTSFVWVSALICCLPAASFAPPDDCETVSCMVSAGSSRHLRVASGNSHLPVIFRGIRDAC